MASVHPDRATIAVLGDLHGHITLALTILERWQYETGRMLDHILQVGDFGVWPYPFLRIDQATQRFAKRDPDEISFPDFLEQSEDSNRFFGSDIGSPPKILADLTFVKGKHEDFEFLNELAGD